MKKKLVVFLRQCATPCSAWGPTFEGESRAIDLVRCFPEQWRKCVADGNLAEVTVVHQDEVALRAVAIAAATIVEEAVTETGETDVARAITVEAMTDLATAATDQVPATAEDVQVAVRLNRLRESRLICLKHGKSPTWTRMARSGSTNGTVRNTKSSSLWTQTETAC